MIEMIITLFLVSFFFLMMATSLASSSKIYIERLDESRATAILETVCDDIAGYAQAGEELNVFYIVPDDFAVKEIRVGGVLLSDTTVVAGAYIYPDGTWRLVDQYGNVVEVGGNPAKGDLDAYGYDPTAYVGNAIDLGFKKIYVKKITVNGQERDYFQGLPYAPQYYARMTMIMRVKQEDEGLMVTLSSVDQFGDPRGGSITKYITTKSPQE